jgi:uncharacterized protein (DUF736 family)
MVESGIIQGVEVMNIGEIKPVNGRLEGHIATRLLDLPRLGLRHVQSSNERAPVFEVIARNVGGRWVQIGALWEATANATGESFLQGSLDDPSLPEPLPIALFGTDEEGYRVAWRRRESRDDFGSSQRSPRREMSGGGTSGGFGDSTAGADGSLMGGTDLDDEVPY